MLNNNIRYQISHDKQSLMNFWLHHRAKKGLSLKNLTIRLYPRTTPFPFMCYENGDEAEYHEDNSDVIERSMNPKPYANSHGLDIGLELFEVSSAANGYDDEEEPCEYHANA